MSFVDVFGGNNAGTTLGTGAGTTFGTAGAAVGASETWTLASNALPIPQITSGSGIMTRVAVGPANSTNPEIVWQVATGTSNQVTVLRGQEGSTIAAHSTTDTYVPIISSGFLNWVVTQVLAAVAAGNASATITDGLGDYGALITVNSTAPTAPGAFDVWIGGAAYTAYPYASGTSFNPNDLIMYNGRLFQNSSGGTLVTSSATPLQSSFAATIATGSLTPIPGNGLWTPQDSGLIACPYDPSLTFAATPFSGAGVIQGVRVHVDQATTVSNIVMDISTAGATLTQGQCFACLFGPFFGATIPMLSPTADASGATYTVSTVSGTPTVTGTGFVSSAMKAGQYTIAGVTGTFAVLSVGSGTSLTMATNIPTTVSAAVMTPVAATVWNSTGYKIMPLVTPQAILSGDYGITFWANGGTMPGPLRASTAAQVNGVLSGGNSRYFTANTTVTTPPSTLTGITALGVSYCPGLS